MLWNWSRSSSFYDMRSHLPSWNDAHLGDVEEKGLVLVDCRNEMSNLRQMQGGGGKNPEYVDIGSEGRMELVVRLIEVATQKKKTFGKQTTNAQPSLNRPNPRRPLGHRYYIHTLHFHDSSHTCNQIKFITPTRYFLTAKQVFATH